MDVEAGVEIGVEFVEVGVKVGVDVGVEFEVEVVEGEVEVNFRDDVNFKVGVNFEGVSSEAFSSSKVGAHHSRPISIGPLSAGLGLSR